MIKDYVIIIGAMKSGTTTLFEQLAGDPRVAGASNKEPGFFAFEEVRSMGWDWYEGLFGFEPGRHRYALEASTDYTKAPFVTGVADRLRDAAPRRFKLIYVVREPVSRLASHARHAQADGMEVGRFVSPREAHGFDAGLSPVNLAASDYADQLVPYEEWRASGDLLVLTLDEVRRDGQAVMDRVAAFLGLPDLRWREEAARANPAEAKRRQSAWWTALASAAPLRAAAKAVLSEGARRALRERATTPARTEGRFEPTPEERAALRARYAAQLDRLETEHGVAVPDAWR